MPLFWDYSLRNQLVTKLPVSSINLLRTFFFGRPYWARWLSINMLRTYTVGMAQSTTYLWVPLGKRNPKSVEEVTLGISGSVFWTNRNISTSFLGKFDHHRNPLALARNPPLFFFLPFLQKWLLLHLYGLWHPSYVGETLILHFTLTFSCAGCCKRHWVGTHEDLKICPKFHIRRQPNYKKCKIDRYFSLLNYCFTVCHIILTIFYPQYKVYHIGIWYSLLKICWSIRLDVLQSIELEQAKWYSQILNQYFLNFLGFEIFFY